jgi:putative DNA primase/helicase
MSARLEDLELARRQYKDDIRARLLDRLEELFNYLTGKQPSLRKRGRVYWGAKQSISLVTTGQKRGLFMDREADVGGDVFDAIGHFLGVKDFSARVEWAVDWLGVPPFDATVESKVDRQAEDQARAARQKVEEEKARRQAEEDAATAARKVEDARRYWVEATPQIDGTPGEIYLKKTRRIPIADGYPPSVRWHAGKHALIFAVTGAEGEVVAVQFVAVTKQGEKDTDRYWSPRDTQPRAKNTVAAVSKGVLRFPGPADGPVVMCEGPETTMSVWAAGYEAVATIGPISLKRIPELFEKGRKIVIGFDDDIITGTNARKEWQRKRDIRELNHDGYDVVVVKPFNVRQQNKSDFNDLLKLVGVAGIRRRIAEFVSPRDVTSNYMHIDEAREKMNVGIAADMRKLVGWARSSESEFAPSYGYKLPAGLGKTRAFIKAIGPVLREMRARGDYRVIAISTPFHDLGDDIHDRYDEHVEEEADALDILEEEARGAFAGEFVVQSYRGREARRPRSDDLMCENIEVVREASKRRLRDIKKVICRAECKFSRGCPYLAQDGMDPDIIIISQAMLSSMPPKATKDRGVALLIVDETPWQSFILPDDEILVRTIEDMPLGDEEGQEDDIARFAALRQILVEAVIENGEGPLMAELLKRRGFDTESAAFGVKREWLRTISEGHWRDPAWKANESVDPMMRAFQAAGNLIRSKKAESGWLRVERVERHGANNLILRVRGVRSIGKHWRAPSLHLDASLEAVLLRFFWPTLVEREKMAVEAPHATILQVTDKSFAKSQLEPLKGEVTTEEGRKIDAARKMERDRVHAFIARNHLGHGGEAYAVFNKGVEAAMELTYPPADDDSPEAKTRRLRALPGVETGHYNALVGKDGWGKTRSSYITPAGPSPPQPTSSAWPRPSRAMSSRRSGTPIRAATIPANSGRAGGSLPFRPRRNFTLTSSRN